MDPQWAAQNLQTIRLLMERAAIYRRALAPIMIWLGSLGSISAAIGWFSHLTSPRIFVLYWMLVCLLGLSGTFFLARREAVRASEDFWSPPARRAAQALMPALVVGLFSAIVTIFPAESHAVFAWWLLPLWVVLYGCAVHAVGFFTPRGMKLFGWGFVVGGGIFAILLAHDGGILPFIYAHWVMGFFFGFLHLAYGVYLHFTEKSLDEM